MAIFTEATLSDSFIYAAFNNNKVMSLRVAEIIKSGMEVAPEQLEETLLHIKRTRLSPLMDEVLGAFEKGEISLVYSDTISIPASIPFVVIKQGSNHKGIIFVKRYGNFNKAGDVYTINPKVLYVLMEATYLSIIYYKHPERFVRSAGLVKVLSNIYSVMMMRILNKEYALTLDPDLHSQVSYIVSRFFLDRVVELPNKDISHSYASKNANATTPLVLQSVREEYENANITNFEELIDFLGKYNKRLTGINKKLFIQVFMNTYGPVSILGLDCLPYFILTVTSTLMGSFLVNETILSDIIKNTRGLNANVVYPELSKIV